MSTPKIETKEIPENWSYVGRFSELSSTDELKRKFLDAVPKFKLLEASEVGVPNDGFPMPNTSGFGVTQIVGLEFVPDQPDGFNTIPDGEIYIIKA